MYEKIRLSPGLLVLRHVAPAEGTADAALRPIVPLAARGDISLMFDPATPEGILTRPGQICLIRVARPAVLLLEITAVSGKGAPRGGIELDYLTRSDPLPADPPAMADLTVYVEGVGDRAARYGDWVGDEAGVQPLVGMLLPLRLQGPRILLRDPLSGQIAAPGEFLGGRGGFRPLAGLDLWIETPDGQHRLVVAADFALAGRVEASGTALSLRGAGEGDRLVRLRLALSPLVTPGQETRAVPRGNRLRIFRKDDDSEA